MSVLMGLAVAFSVGMGIFGMYVLVQAVRFFSRANQALDIYLSEKARERYQNWPPRD